MDETAVAIRRGSAEENFEYWDDLIILYRTDGQKEYSYNYKDTVSSSVMVYPSNTKDKTIVAFADNTVKSGVLYKYYLQAISGNIRIGKTQAQENFVVFDNAFLSTRGKTLVIKYDAEFTGFKRTKLDTKTETLGSKYPFIRRNGAVDYKQITLSGLISYLADEEQLFCSQDYLHNLSFYDETTYNKYKKRYNINPYNDTITERNFREKVLDFLYSDNVKLFRTSQEGNILVKLMDITLTPKQELGRHIYSFSCTAYEVADDGVPNYQKYQVY